MVVIAGVFASHICGVADERQVGLERLGVVGEEGGQRRRAGLLLALEQRGDVARQPAVGRKARQASTKVISWPLSSQAPRADDALCRWARREPRLEGRSCPELQRVDGLNVVMAVEQHVRRVARLGLGGAHHHRPPGRVLPRGFEAEVGELARRASRRRARNRENARGWRRSRGSRAARRDDAGLRPDWRRSSKAHPRA